MKKIYFPHLHYTIKYGIARGATLNKMARNKWGMMTHIEDGNTSIIYFVKKPTMLDMPTVAHEVMHCLQSMTRNRTIDMSGEEEHMAYCMQYALNTIYGLKYEPVS